MITKVSLVKIKNMECFTNLHAILVQGHVNLLCIVPLLVYVLPKQAPRCILYTCALNLRKF